MISAYNSLLRMSLAKDIFQNLALKTYNSSKLLMNPYNVLQNNSIAKKMVLERINDIKSILRDLIRFTVYIILKKNISAKFSS